jgi:hypothetical protein
MTTLGEAVDKNGPLLCFELIRQLAEKVGRIPVGFWEYALSADWKLTVNGTKEKRDEVMPYHARIVGVGKAGWPIVAILNPAQGSVMGGTQDDIEIVLRRALEIASKPNPPASSAQKE